jgi:hypothetical protein
MPSTTAVGSVISERADESRLPVIISEIARDDIAIKSADKTPPPFFLAIAADPNAIEQIGAKTNAQGTVEPATDTSKEAIAIAITEKRRRLVHITTHAAHIMQTISDISSDIGESQSNKGRGRVQTALITAKTKDGVVDEERASPSLVSVFNFRFSKESFSL